MRRDERGQATLELALCLPFLALVLTAVVEVGALVADDVRLWHAAREAARAAVVDPDPAAARAAAERAGLSRFEMTISPEPAYRVQGGPLTVSLTYEPRTRLPLLGALMRAIELHAEASMRIEQP
jgi:Flp pilus assembly protein TadG